LVSGATAIPDGQSEFNSSYCSISSGERFSR
jgi:hypothetical protein